MNKKLIAGLAVGAALVGGIAVAGSELSDRKVERAKQFITWKLDDALDELDANDRQRETAVALKDQLFEEGLKVKGTHEQVREGLVAQWKSDRVDANTVHALVDRFIDGARAFAHKAADAGITLHGALTPEQRALALQKMEERRGRWHR